MLIKIKGLGNEKSILPLILALYLIANILAVMPAFAWQEIKPANSTFRINTEKMLDSLPDLNVTRGIDSLRDSARNLQSGLNAYKINTDSLTPRQIQQIKMLKANGDSLITSLETRQSQIETKINQLESRAEHMQDSIYRALRKKIKKLRTKGKLSPKADSLWEKLSHSPTTKKLKGQMGEIKPPDHKIGEMDQLVNQLKQDKISPEFTGDIHQTLTDLKGNLKHHEQLAAVKTEISAVRSNFTGDFQQFKEKINPDWLSSRQGQLQQLQEHANGIKAYGDQVANAPGALEQQAKNLEEVQAFENQKSTFSPHQEQIKALGKEDYTKEQVVKKAKTMAKDHFAGHQEKLKAAQNKLGELKRHIGKPGGIDLNGEKIKKPNPMKDKTLGERLVWGGNFQVHPGEEVSLDISPSLAYRWTKMFRLGVGGTYRTTIDEDEKFFLSDDHEVFGYRGFGEHEVYKGFFAHIEYERLRSGNNSFLGRIRDGDRDVWQSSALAGMGKSYKIRHKIKGNVLLLYNFLYDEHSHYNNPWNVRFGFEMIHQGPKKQQKSNTENQKE